MTSHLLHTELSIKQLKEIIRRYGNRIELKSSQSAVERQQLEEICRICLTRSRSFAVLEGEGGDGEENLESLFISTKYDLVANICHDSIISQGVSIVTDPKAKTSKGSGSSGGSNDPTNVLQNGIYRIHVQNKVRR